MKEKLEYFHDALDTLKAEQAEQLAVAESSLLWIVFPLIKSLKVFMLKNKQTLPSSHKERICSSGHTEQK